VNHYTRKTSGDANSLWAAHGDAWRTPRQVLGFWQTAAPPPPALLAYSLHGDFCEILAARRITLFVTREYEHFALALNCRRGALAVSCLEVPHPSGLVADRRRGRLLLASTRNPNQIIECRPIAGLLPRRDVRGEALGGRPLAPVRTWFHPGCLYLHDLALIGGRLHANAVGQNAVVCFEDDGACRRAWWPRVIGPARGAGHFDQNYLQLNSIAAGRDLASSFFSASTDRVSQRRPGHRNFAVNRRGVIFSGATRDVLCRGLTRPHSARLHRGRLWVDNSGYGEVGLADGAVFEPVARLPGWTRGLCFHDDIAFVATSRVLPRFRQYAPGLDADASLCGVHALDLCTGRVLGSIVWPGGNQVFALDWLPAAVADGFSPAADSPRARRAQTNTFYAFSTRATRTAS
jgi:uncharacterized protein (TIGR03032 family)